MAADANPLPGRVFRAVLLLAVPVLVVLAVAWFAARRAADVWPPVDTAAVESLPALMAACAKSEDLLYALLRVPLGVDEQALSAAFQPVGGPPSWPKPLPPSPELDDALRAVEACGGTNLIAADVAGSQVHAARLGSVARLLLLRSWQRSADGDAQGAAADFVTVLTLSASLEHAGGDVVLTAAGVDVGLLVLDQLELWLDAPAGLSDESLSRLAEGFAEMVALPAGVPRTLARQCRDGEAHLLYLGAIPAPAMLLEPAGAPLWAGWASELLPGASVYDAPHTLAMHRQRCAQRLAHVRAGGLWEDPEPGPVLWDPEQPTLGTLLDNPLGRITLSQDDLGARADALIRAGRTLRSRRALVATRVAVERGSRAHEGLLPLQLDLLTPEFLPAPPVDPVDGQALNWVRSHGEIFTTREVVGSDGQARRLVTRVPER